MEVIRKNVNYKFQFNEPQISYCHNSQLFNFISSHQFLQLPSIIDTVRHCFSLVFKTLKNNSREKTIKIIKNMEKKRNSPNYNNGWIVKNKKWDKMIEILVQLTESQVECWTWKNCEIMTNNWATILWCSHANLHYLNCQND